MAPQGGTNILATLSDQSTHSTRFGYSDTSDPLTMSPTISISRDGDSFGQSAVPSTGLHRHHRRETPSTLGWAQDSVLVKLYAFIVMKGKESYLELQSDYRVTPETPRRVYLDTPRDIQKGTYPCQFPGCQSKKAFNRPADLERHYRNVHVSESQRERYQCDYSKCDRAADPFTRKDHYRDHLRDYHKEDLGQAKGAKTEDRPKWERAQKVWLAERNISSDWWRCAKCLLRVHAAEEGWECQKCNEKCDLERQMMRGEPIASLYDSIQAGSPSSSVTVRPQDQCYDIEPWSDCSYDLMSAT